MFTVIRHRLTILFICLFVFSTVVGQTINKYKYVYKFQLIKQNDDSSSCVVETLPNGNAFKTITGKVQNNKSESVSPLTVILKNHDTLIYAMTNDQGLFQLNAKPSSYDLTISGVNYISVTKSLAISGINSYHVSVKLASRAPIVSYVIHSKKELIEEEINKIKKCVKGNRSRPFNRGKTNWYYVTLEI